MTPADPACRISSLARRRGAGLLGLLILIPLIAAACSEAPAVRKQKSLERGLAYQAAGKHSEAVIELRNALQVDPDFVPALHALGAAYRGKSFHGDALRELQRALRLQPDSLPARAELGQVFLAVEAWDDAEAQGKAILGKEPGNAHGMLLVGAAHTGRGEPKKNRSPVPRRGAGSRHPRDPERVR